MNGIPRRNLGRTGATVSALAMGGHHLGDTLGFDETERMVHEAIDAGITFFDNCWEYYNGRTEDWAGRAIASSGKRKQVLLMTKVCTHGRDASLAMTMLEQSLRRFKTDYLDVWQVHGMCFDNDPELAYRKGGVIEALDAAKRAGKVRFVGFTGHKNPDIHLRLIELGYPFDTVQMPLNCFDATYRSFEKHVVPEAQKRGIGILGMKPMTGNAGPIKRGDVSAAEMLRYAMSLPVATTISGMDSLDKLRQNLAVARDFKPMSEAEMQALRERCRARAADGRYELYKGTLVFDNPQARLAHGFPIDEKQKEVKAAFEEATSLTPQPE
jgi:uncharacterized protein